MYGTLYFKHRKCEFKTRFGLVNKEKAKISRKMDFGFAKYN